MVLKKRVGLSLAFIFIVGIFLINGIYAASAADTLNASLNEAKAVDCISSSKVIMQTMTDEGFNILSIKDNIKQAELTFTTQTLLKEKKSPYDFSLVIPYCDTVKKIREDALNAKDELSSLMAFYNDSVVPGMNTSTIDLMISGINEAMSTERYTEVSALVEKAYNEITTVKSSYTALNIFYASTATGLKAFLMTKNPILQIENWKFLSGLIILILFLLIIYRVQIRKMNLKKKLNRLMNRKKTIKELIMKTQKDYFQYGTIPEGEYGIKTKRFAELIRDIDRQIPLLQEEIAKLSGGAKSIIKSDSDGETDWGTRGKSKENVQIKTKTVLQKSVAHKSVVHKKMHKLKHVAHTKHIQHSKKVIGAKKRR